MTTIKEHDFVEIDYTGTLLDGTVFDTTEKAVVKEFNLERKDVHPVTICVGEKQILPGLDKELIGKEVGKEYQIKLSPEYAFGKRDIKKMKIVSSNSFKDHNLEPRPGLQIDVDGEIGTITRVSGGRVIVNFNHPLAGKEVNYKVKVNKIITDKKEQLKVYLNATMRIPKDNIEVEVKENKAEVKVPINLPAPILEILSKKLSELTKLKEVKVVAENSKPVASPADQ